MGDAFAWRSRCISLLRMVQTSSALTKRPSYWLNQYPVKTDIFFCEAVDYKGEMSAISAALWPSLASVVISQLGR